MIYSDIINIINIIINIKNVRLMDPECIGLLGLPQQNTINWVTYTTDISSQF